MTEIRIGLIGYGQWTRIAFVPALKLDNRAKIVSASAASKATQDRIRAELGTDAQVFGGYEELLKGPELDAVMMAIPDGVHESAMNAALDAGVPLYYEPPLADHPDGIAAMLAKLKHAGQITHADLEMGFAPAVLRASRLLHEGAIGAPQALHLKLRCNWAGYEGPNLSLAHHLGPWYMDALNTIIGRPPERVLVMDGTGRPGLRQFHTLVQLDYSGLWGTLQLNINSLDALETTIEATGDDGDMVIDYFKNTIHLRSRSNPDGECIDVHTDGPTVGGWPGERESIVDFLNAVESGGPNRTHGSMAAEIYLAGLAAETSRSAGDWETVGSL